MASIIKVDQIQTAAGGTPTAADLGINTTGSVINTAFYEWKTETVNNTTTYADVTDSTLVYTPVSDNSSLYLTVSAHLQGYNSSYSSGGVIRMLLNGTEFTEPTQYYENFIGATNANSMNWYWRSHNQYKITNTSLSSKTFKMQVRKYDINDVNIKVNAGGLYYSSYMILEIAG